MSYELKTSLNLKYEEDKQRDLDGSAGKMKQDFLKLVSHQINSIIQPILISSEILQQTCRSSNDARVVAILKQAVDRFERFARSVITIQTWTAGLGRPQLSRLDMETLVEQAIASLEREKSLDGYVFLTDLDPTAAPYADPDIAQFCLEGILRNTVEYSGRSCSVWIRSNVGKLYYSLIIEDDGPGFPEDILKRFPEPFLTDSLVESGHHGLGLHLANVSIIMRTLGGDFRIGRSLKGGALTEISLPLDNRKTENVSLLQ